GEAHRPRLGVRVRPGHRDGVPDSRRALRALAAAVRRGARGAVRGRGRAQLRRAARAGERHLFPDRPGGAHRAGGEERDPDRRVFTAGLPRGQVPGRGRAACRAPALPADHHDLARLRARRDAPHGVHGSGRRRAPLDGDRRGRRDARRDLHCDAVRAAVLRAGGEAAEDAPRGGACLKRFCLVALFALAGCAVGPDYERPAIALPADYPVGAPAGEATVPAEWWTLYRDATLEDLVAATRANNADIRLAAAQVEEAEAVLRQVRAALFPEITGGLQRSRTRVSSLTAPPPLGGFPLVRPNTRLFASTNFEVDFWGRLGRAGEAARASLLGSRFARDVVTLSLGSLTAQTYFGLRSLDAQLAVLQETIRTRRDSLELARARVGGGLASELDLHQAQAALSDVLMLEQLTGKPDLRLAAGDLFTLPVP